MEYILAQKTGKLSGAELRKVNFLAMATTEYPVITYRYSLNELTVPVGTTFFPYEADTSQAELSSISIELMPIIEGTPIPDSPHVLRHALITELHTSRDGYVIQSAHIDEDGYGTTVSEAYIDFLTSIRDRYNSMTERESHLSTYEIEILQNLRNLLEPS